MKNQLESLSTLSLNYWFAKRAHLANRKDVEKRGNFSNARHQLLNRVKFGVCQNNAPEQREGLNRRQIKAMVDGVKVYKTSIVCGVEFNKRAW